ncbi:MAG: glycosyltransferase [Planctomycetota bacterium]|nr:glycosyltransferase [Planctomycetota bacterium]
MTQGYRILYHHRIRADDGQAVHVRELIHALRGEGHEVMECALVPKADASSAAVEASSQGGWLRHLRLPRVMTEVMEVAYNRHGRRMLAQTAESFSPDFIYERHALHCRSGLLTARDLGIPLLLEVNSPMCDEMEKLGLLKFPRRARRTEREVLGGADRVLAVTEVLRDRLIACGSDADRTRVIGNGAVLMRYGEEARSAAAQLREGFPSGAFMIGFFGYARDWHRLDLALEAMSAADLEKVHLLLVGEGPATASIQHRAVELGLEDRLIVAGGVSAADLPAYVCSCDAALIPAINAYASPLKLFDSLAAGIATLAPDQPNLREVLRDTENGLLFTPGSSEALAAKMRVLMTDTGIVRRIGEAGRRSLIEHDRTWTGNARRVIAMYEELAS